MGAGSASQPTSRAPSARGYLPLASNVNDQLEAAGINPFGFRTSSRNSNPGRPPLGRRPGSGNFMMRPVSRQQSQPSSQTRGAPIPVFSPELEEEMHSQASYHFDPYQQSQHRGQFQPRYNYQPFQLDDQFHSQQYQSLYDDHFHSQHSQQQLQYVDQFRSQNSQSVPLPPAQFKGQMKHPPDVANFDMPCEVQGVQSTQLAPEAPITADIVPKRPPMKEYFANVKKRTAAALEAEADDAPTESDSSSSDPKPITTTPSNPPRSREPIQRPAREVQGPMAHPREPDVATPKPQPDGQDKPENQKGSSIVGDKHGGRVTRSRAKKGSDGQPDANHDHSNHNDKDSAPTSSLPAPISEGSPEQREQPSRSTRSVATATDPSGEHPPNKKLKEVSKKDFQELLKADDLVSVAMKKGITSHAVLEAALLGKIMAEDDDFSRYVELALNEVD